MPAINFPAIKPTGRSYTPGAYPQNEFQALNGATTILRYGNQRSSGELSLEFDNITDQRAAQIMHNYELQHAGDNWVVFDGGNGLAGAEPELRAYLGEVVTGLRWRYAEPPSLTSVQPGRSSVRVKFTAYLDA
jgi:hypothetical protein